MVAISTTAKKISCSKVEHQTGLQGRLQQTTEVEGTQTARLVKDGVAGLASNYPHRAPHNLEHSQQMLEAQLTKPHTLCPCDVVVVVLQTSRLG